MDRKQKFYDAIKNDMTTLLATAAGDSVTMRLIGPVLYGDGVLLFTDAGSRKYRQLQANPHCCLMAGGYFAEATAAFPGATMREENAPLREAYCEKFPGAFDEGVEFGGRDCDFVLLTPTKLTGWDFVNDIPTADGVPTVPFAIDLP